MTEGLIGPTIVDRTASLTSTPGANTIAILGACSSGTATLPYEVEREADASTSLGDGPLVELGAAVVRHSKTRQVLVRVTCAIAATISAVTESPAGPGPSVAASGTPLDTYDAKVKITLAGALGTGKFRVTLDGGSYGPELDLPVKAAGAVQGTVDLTTVTLADLNALTFIVDSSGASADTTTFTTPSSVQDVVDQINSGATGYLASLVQGRYLRVTDSVTGSAATIQVTTGTANATMGFTNNTSATGTDATYAIPHTGVTLTFPAGTYVLDTTYSFTTTEPRFTTTDLGLALDALRSSGVQFGDVFVAVRPVDGSETRLFADYLSARAASWGAGTPKKVALFAMGASVGAAGSPAANDLDVKAEMTGHSDPYVCVAHGDTYMTGSNLIGKARRPASFALAIRMASYRLSSDPGNGEQPPLESCSARSPDGTTKARNEETATTKMQSQGFTTLRENDRREQVCTRGRTRAAPSSKLRHLGVMRMATMGARELIPWANGYVNADRNLAADGTLLGADADNIEAVGTARFEQLLVGPEHASSCRLLVGRTEQIEVTDNITMRLEAQHKAQFASVTIELGVNGIAIAA